MLVAPLALWAQQFEVASVKPSAPDARGNTFNFTPGGGLTILNATFRTILQTAYDVAGFQIQGGPSWMNSDRFDIFAKSESGEAPAGHATPGAIQQTRLKLQALLADRFRLKAHREKRELPIYALAIGKNGPKLTEAAGPTSGPAGMHMACGQMTGTGTTMENFARSLTRELGRPVEDRTGLPAKYNFQVNWTPDNGPCQDSSSDLPSIFGALQGQLGLKLESTKGPVEIVVVDSVEKPAAN